MQAQKNIFYIFYTDTITRAMGGDAGLPVSASIPQ